MSANEDGACALVLGGADGKAISSSWQLNARSSSEDKWEGCPRYIYTRIKSNKSSCEHRYTNRNMRHRSDIHNTKTHGEVLHSLHCCCNVATCLPTIYSAHLHTSLHYTQTPTYQHTNPTNAPTLNIRTPQGHSGT